MHTENEILNAPFQTSQKLINDQNLSIENGMAYLTGVQLDKHSYSSF